MRFPRRKVSHPACASQVRSRMHERPAVSGRETGRVGKRVFRVDDAEPFSESRDCVPGNVQPMGDPVSVASVQVIAEQASAAVSTMTTGGSRRTREAMMKNLGRRMWARPAASGSTLLEWLSGSKKVDESPAHLRAGKALHIFQSKV